MVLAMIMVTREATVREFETTPPMVSELCEQIEALLGRLLPGKRSSCEETGGHGA